MWEVNHFYDFLKIVLFYVRDLYIVYYNIKMNGLFKSLKNNVEWKNFEHLV